MASARDLVGYARTVAAGSPVDRTWSTPGMLWSMLRHGRGLAAKGSPRNLQDIRADPEYRDIATPKVAEGDVAPDFELPLADGSGTAHLASLLRERPVALVFGSYT
jgi:hypothetical protein